VSVCVCVCVHGYVRVALGIQYVMRMRNIVICGLLRSAIFFDIIYERHDFRVKIGFLRQNLF